MKKQIPISVVMIATAASAEGPVLYALGSTGHVFKTKDEGGTWSVIELPSEMTIEDGGDEEQTEIFTGH